MSTCSGGCVLHVYFVTCLYPLVTSLHTKQHLLVCPSSMKCRPSNLSSDREGGNRERRTAVEGNPSHKPTTSFRWKSTRDPRESTVALYKMYALTTLTSNNQYMSFLHHFTDFLSKE